MMSETIEQQPVICIEAATWGALQTKWQMTDWRAKTEWDAYVALPDDSPDRHWMSDLVSESADASENATDALMAMPAPHLAALRWKLDRVFTFHSNLDADKFMDSYCFEYVRQTMDDYKRLLPETV